MTNILRGDTCPAIPSASAADEALSLITAMVRAESEGSEVIAFEVDVVAEGLDLVRERTISVDHLDR